jgi:hypothetical protein
MKVKFALAGLAFCILTQPILAQTAVERVVIPALKNAEIKGYYTSRDDFKVYKGEYALSNGKILQLKRFSTRMFAQVGTQTEHEIVRTARGTFVALDRTMHIALEVDNNGDLNGSMTYIDEDIQKTADLSPESAIISVAMR